MAKHLTDSELARYRERTLPPQALLAANAHLFDCEACHVRYGAHGQLDAAFDFLTNIEASGAEESHPSFEQLAAYVDEALGESERLVTVAHLDECEECEAQVRDLRPLRDLLAPSTKIAAPDVVASGIAAPDPATARRPALTERLRAVWRVPAYRMAAQAAAAILVVALLAWALTRPFRTDSADQRTQTPLPTQEQPQTAEAAGGVSAPGAEDDETQPSPDANGSNASQQPALAHEAAPDSSRVVLAVNDAGGRVALDAGGRVLGLDSVSDGQRELVGKMLTNARVETPRLPWKSDNAGDALLGSNGGGASFALLGPVGKVVRDARPTLRWRPLKDATSYVVTIRDAQSRTTATSGAISSTEWRVSQPLRRGAVYSWQVLAVWDPLESTCRHASLSIL